MQGVASCQLLWAHVNIVYRLVSHRTKLSSCAYLYSYVLNKLWYSWQQHWPTNLMMIPMTWTVHIVAATNVSAVCIRGVHENGIPMGMGVVLGY